MSHKPALVILPGWGGSHETWADFIKLASEDFDVQCIDLPCFGNEPCPTEIWGVEEYADFVKSKVSFRLELKPRVSQKHALSHVEGSKVILVGHSFGGQIAAYFAAKYPEHLQALICIGASAVRPRKLVRRAVFGAIAKVGNMILSLPLLNKAHAAARRLFLRGIGAHDSIAVEGMKREIYKKIIRQDLRHILPKIKIPTLVIWGSSDSMTPLRQGKQIARLIPNAKLMVIRGGRHGLHLTHEKQMLVQIEKFAVGIF